MWESFFRSFHFLMFVYTVFMHIMQIILFHFTDNCIIIVLVRCCQGHFGLFLQLTWQRHVVSLIMRYLFFHIVGSE